MDLVELPTEDRIKGGMQNDAAMTAEDDESFKPIWVALIWPAVPYGLFQETDALTRTELLI